LNISHGAQNLNNTSLTSPETLIEASALCRTYHRGSEEVHAIEDASFNIPDGAFALLIGPSGSGKSTLLNLISGIDRPTSGSLVVCGNKLNDLKETQLDDFRRKYIGFVFQFNNLLPNLNAVENVALPLVAKGTSWREARSRAHDELSELGLARRANHRPFELSGGEQQRVALARATISRPDIVLADEPTGDLDAKSASMVIELMISINHELGVTFLLATHNTKLQTSATQIIALSDGRVNPNTGAA
jgi:ABC-type lipoprotein export system ATPase subunit